MKNDNNLIKIIDNLGRTQKQELLELLTRSLSDDSNVLEIREVLFNSQDLTCFYCSCSRVGIHHRTNRGTRYKCYSCKKTFSQMTGSAICGIHDLNKWHEYVSLFLHSTTIREAAKKLKINTHTAFNWRHKILSALSQHTWIQSLRGIAEVDEKLIEFNEKGSRRLKRKAYKRPSDRPDRTLDGNKVCVLVTHERLSKKIEMGVVQRGRIKKVTLKEQLLKKINEATIVCSDRHRSYTGWAKDNSINLKTIKARDKQYTSEGIYHVQNINSNNNIFEKWYSKFSGVASKYLNNYLNWYNILRDNRRQCQQLERTLSLILSPNNCIAHYIRIPDDFKKIWSPHSFTT